MALGRSGITQRNLSTNQKTKIKNKPYMNSIFKIKIVCYQNNGLLLQDGIRPDCILYTGPVTDAAGKFGISARKWNKAVSKVIGKYTSEIPISLDCLIFIKYKKEFFITTHAMGTHGEHTVFHEEPFKRSLENFKMYKGVN